MRIILYLLLALIISCSDNGQSNTDNPTPFSKEIDIDDDFYFEKGIYQVVDNVYVAIGYGLANSILIVGDTGNIIIDTTEDPELGKQINDEFKKISNLPNEAIIYTHSHVDHWRGAPGFYENNTKVYAHSTFQKGFFDQNNLLRPILTERGMKQFGHFLPDSLKRGHGLGFTLNFNFEQPPVIYPTHFFELQTNKLSVGGVDLEIQHTPGETDDQIIIYYPDKDVVISADNYYMRFPNLYTIRGTSYRDSKSWYKSVDAMRSYQPQYLISCHGPFLTGKDVIEERLSTYRDAIQFIHDYAIRGANAGKTPDELVEEFEYPPFFLEHYDLQEKYGKVSWSIRNVYNGYLGFFDGRAVNLEPLSKKKRALFIFELVGSKERLIEEIDKANYSSNYQWAAELSDIGLLNFPNDKDIKNLYSESLENLSKIEKNPIARNYYLSEAYELSGKITPSLEYSISAEQAKNIPLSTFFDAMGPRLDPIKAKGKLIKVGFNITDLNETYGVVVRNQIAEVSNSYKDDYDVIVSVDSDTWKGIILKTESAARAIASGKLRIDGEAIKFLQFSLLFVND
jgi:alkyl sulfatase BDS1-like metallo-beta-lactamase superfamily hydrolase